MSLLGAPGNIESAHDQTRRLPMLDARQACAAGSDKTVHAFVADLGTVIDAKQDERDFGTLLEGWDGAGGITT
ncbi:MAG: hypothetical protein WAO08_13330 [Hyphomicrobiaceae bacterium]